MKNNVLAVKCNTFGLNKYKLPKYIDLSKISFGAQLTLATCLKNFPKLKSNDKKIIYNTLLLKDLADVNIYKLLIEDEEFRKEVKEHFDKLPTEKDIQAKLKMAFNIKMLKNGE